jgi:spore germination cell wall hydrolase CwlJ-like protein
MRPLRERDYIALTIYGECRGESTVGKMAVASVLRNRLALGRWGTTYERVCLAPSQFSCWNRDDPNRAVLDRLADQLRDGVILSDPALRECAWIADGLLASAFASPVHGATHYYARSMTTPPTWANPPAVLEAVVGNHLFFSGVR